jgi:hypothetical protein
MPRDMRSRRRPATGLLIALALALATAALPGCGSEDASDEPAAAAPEETGERRRATRKVAAGCDPVAESAKYESFVGKRALAVLSWDGASQDTAALQIPVHVVGSEGDTLQIRVLEIPMREQYLHIWIGSGHIEPGPETSFLLHPCSASLRPWPNAPSD